MRMHRSLSLLALAAAVLTQSSCGMLKSVTPDIHLSKLPGVKTITNLVPGLGSDGKASSEDPDVPVNLQGGTLGYGHTLRLEVYEGATSASRIYRGVSMVNSEGLLPLGKVGSARLGGLRPGQAAEAIASAFRLGGQHTRPLTVHILAVENTPVLLVNGDVKEPALVPAFENMNVMHAIQAAGGRKAGSVGRGVYIHHEGQRKFFTSLESAALRWTPEAGDVITLSPDI